jgi:hypothetical protein
MPIQESDAQIEKLIIAELMAHAQEVLVASRQEIARGIQKLVIEEIKRSPEYAALLHGRLLAEFGLTNAVSKVDAILGEWSKQLQVTVTKKSLTVEMIKRDLINVLAMAEAKQLTAKGENLEWLNWLLIDGDRTIVREYAISLKPNRRSRTGFALMVKNPKKKWSVPSEYAGTRNNNWVTRAIDTILDSLVEDLIISAIEAKW